MAQATTKKLTKAQPVTVDSLEAMRYDTKPVKAPKMQRGYTYVDPIAILVRFEKEKRDKAYKIMNKEDKSFTAVQNDALDLLLYSRGLITVDEIKSEEIRNLITAIYKPLKYKSKKQKT